MDVSYPLARYSALLTDLVALVGGADDRLDRLSWREQGWREQGPPEQRQAVQRQPGPGSREPTAREAADA
jgi:hypothetical protein